MQVTRSNNFLGSRRRRLLRGRKSSIGTVLGPKACRLLIAVITTMIAASTMIARRNPSYFMRALTIHQVHGLSATSVANRRSSSSTIVSPPFGYRYTIGPHPLSQRHRAFTSERKDRRRHHPLGTASVSPPEISSSEDEEDYQPSDEGDWNHSESSSAASLKQDFLLRDLNPSQVEAVTQPLFLFDEGTRTSSSVVTRVIAGPGSGKTKVLTTRIAHLLHNDPYGKVLAVTFTRKAAGEMKERLEKLLVEQEQVLEGVEGVNEGKIDTNAIVQERAQEPGVVDAEGSTNPKGIERVELGTFHSICAKILRYNGDLLRDLPSVQRDMSKAQPIWVEKISPGAANNDSR